MINLVKVDLSNISIEKPLLPLIFSVNNFIAIISDKNDMVLINPLIGSVDGTIVLSKIIDGDVNLHDYDIIDGCADLEYIYLLLCKEDTHKQVYRIYRLYNQFDMYISYNWEFVDTFEVVDENNKYCRIAVSSKSIFTDIDVSTIILCTNGYMIHATRIGLESEVDTIHCKINTDIDTNDSDNNIIDYLYIYPDVIIAQSKNNPFIIDYLEFDIYEIENVVIENNTNIEEEE